MLEFGAPPVPLQEPDEEDWFGEGNAFESGEDLATALLAMAADPAGEAPPAEMAVLTSSAPALPRDSFVLAEYDVLPRPEAQPAVVTSAVAATPRGWSVRTPGAVPLPPRAPGRSGWSIRNSVKVLQHTETVMDALREEAIVAALVAAARAIHPD